MTGPLSIATAAYETVVAELGDPFAPRKPVPEASTEEPSVQQVVALRAAADADPDPAAADLTRKVADVTVAKATRRPREHEDRPVTKADAEAMPTLAREHEPRPDGAAQSTRRRTPRKAP
jgi:hypothetical protein